MGVASWLTAHWFDLLQTLGIIGGLGFSAFTTHEDAKARRVSNLIAITARYNDIWQEFYKKPALARVMLPDLDLARNPISAQERLFVKNLIFHLNAVHEARKAGMVMEIERLRKDIGNFFSLPIPNSVWQETRDFQNREFYEFVEASKL